MTCLFEWQTVTLNAGYSFDTAYSAPAYRLELGDVVRLVGIISGPNGVAFTLPVGHRPSSRRRISDDWQENSVEAHPNGDVVITVATSPGGASLEGSFPL